MWGPTVLTGMYASFEGGGGEILGAEEGTGIRREKLKLRIQEIFTFGSTETGLRNGKKRKEILITMSYLNH